jgi:L-fuculose-phosphate aldolase
MNDQAASNVVNDSLRADLGKLARAARILDMQGHSDRVFGHVAMRDPDGRGFWLKRHQISLGEVYDWRDFVLVNWEGKKIYGAGARHSEWPIHAEIFKSRPEVTATGHTHPFHCCIFSAIPDPLISLTRALPAPPPRFELTSELVQTPEMGKALAGALGDHDYCLMRNHGVIFAGKTIETMVLNAIQIEESCQQMLAAATSGLPWEAPPDTEVSGNAVRVSKGYGGSEVLWDYYSRVLERAEAQGLPTLATSPVPVRPH